MRQKTSIRYFNKCPVRAVWQEKDSAWFYSASDVIGAITGTENARRYWNTLKSRHPELSAKAKQVRMAASDGKKYLTDVLSEGDIEKILMAVPTKYREAFASFAQGHNDPLDEKSKRKAYELYEGRMLDAIEVGTAQGLQQIHAFIFAGLYDFAGKLRTVNISKGGFMFANCQFLPRILSDIEAMPDDNLEAIVKKYVELNIAHPFKEGNGRSARIWLDMLLKARIRRVVDWSRIDKEEYLRAMEKSPVDPNDILHLIEAALTDDVDDRALFMKGIDYSYYYEEAD